MADDSPEPVTCRAHTACRAHSLLELPTEVLVVALVLLDARSLARLASTCTALFYPPTSPVADALRHRAAKHDRACNDPLPAYASSTAVHLAWAERRYDEARRSISGGLMCSFVVADGQLFSCGAETRLSPGLLGRGTARTGENRSATTRLTPVSTNGAYINSVSSEFGLGAAVDTAGVVYTWGSRHLGRLTDGSSDDPARPTAVEALSGFRIRSVSVGGNHCLAVAVSGQVFGWGVAINGMCGNGGSTVYQALPSPIRSLVGTRVRSASAGILHSLVVAEDGGIYSFGRGTEGQLGHRGTRDEHTPRRIRALRHIRITSAAAAGTSSLALASDGTVFAWGSDGYGEMESSAPHRVQDLDGVNVRAIVAHSAGRCAVATTGEVYTWGSLPAGLLGHGIGVSHQPTPRRVDALRRECIETVAFGSTHTLAAIRGGGVIGWGDAGMLGLTTEAEADGMSTMSAFQPMRYRHLTLTTTP